MPHQIPVSELQEIARAQYQRQDYQTALKTFTEAIEASVNPTVSLLNDRAVVYERLGQYTLALLDARDAIKLGETNVISYLRAGRILQNINKHSKALEIYKRGMAKVPDKSANDNLRRRHDKLAESLSLSARPSPSGTDPFEKLPVELVEMILADLSFRQVVYVVRVLRVKARLTILATVHEYQRDGRALSVDFLICGTSRTLQELRNKSPNHL